jgi:hypothetical protein
MVFNKVRQIVECDRSHTLLDGDDADQREIL